MMRFMTSFPIISTLLLLPLLSGVYSFSFSCLKDDESCFSSFLNTSSVLNAFLGDHGTVIFQNGILKMGNGTAGNKCPAMSVIFARGTAEPGNVGILTGPPFFAAIAEYMNGTNQLAIQGVNYPADIAGFLAGGSAIGAAMMAALITQTLTLCPSTPLTLSGYSQGAQLVHLATSLLPSNTTSKISSVVLFGDPENGTALQGIDSKRVLTVCHANDDICKGGDRIGIAHLNYSANAAMAAGFALGGMADVGITSMRIKSSDGGIG